MKTDRAGESRRSRALPSTRYMRWTGSRLSPLTPFLEGKNSALGQMVPEFSKVSWSTRLSVDSTQSRIPARFSEFLYPRRRTFVFQSFYGFLQPILDRLFGFCVNRRTYRADQALHPCHRAEFPGKPVLLNGAPTVQTGSMDNRRKSFPQSYASRMTEYFRRNAPIHCIAVSMPLISGKQARS